MSFNGQMLVLARESRRMTQKGLAEASGTVQSAISKAEAGVVVPAAASVAAWASALRYRVDLFSPSRVASPPPRTLFRKQASLSQGDIKAIKASIAIQSFHVEALLRSIELPAGDVPTLRVGKEVESATEAAEILRYQWTLPSGPVENLVETLEDHSIVVVPMQNRARSLSGLSICDRVRGLPPMMFYNGEAPGDRVRWTCGHELGHIVLGHHGEETADDCEGEADEFASEFLMPARDIKHHFSSRSRLEDLAQLKLFWRVSIASLIRRATALGKFTSSHAQRLWKQMSKFGYRRTEPNYFPAEQPSLLAEMVRVHVEELQFSLEEMADLLTLEEDEVRSLYTPDLPVTPGQTPPKLRLIE